MMKSLEKKSFSWMLLLGYTTVLVAAGFIIAFILIRTLAEPPEVSLPSRSPYDPYFVVASAVLMVVSPFVAVFLNWRTKEYFLSYALAGGVLMGSLGRGVGFALFCAVIYYVATKMKQVVMFYLPPRDEEDSAG